jgi:hypothetical protein
MRIPSLRLLLGVGGAVIIATAGFAYMANNTINASSAGEGIGAVYGYTVSGTTYTTTAGQPESITGATFTLTSGAPTGSPASETAPIKVDAFLTAGSLGTVDTGVCAVTGWNSVSGAGSVTCTFPGAAQLWEVTGLDVEANQ